MCRLYHAERLMDRCAFQTENTLCMYRIVFTDPVRMSGRIAVRRTGYSVSLSFSYCCTYSVNSKAKNRRKHYAFSPRLSKKPSRITIAPGGVHGGRGRIFAAENPVFRAASLLCSFCARKSERFQQKLVECVSSGTIHKFEQILCQFKEKTRRLSSAKSSLVTQKWRSDARNCVLRNF